MLRNARWKRRKIAAVAAVICLFATLSALTPRRDDLVGVLAAQRDLPAGHRLSASDVHTINMPGQLVPAHAFTDTGAVVGQTLVGGLSAGSVLTSASVLSAGPSNAGDGEQLVPIRLADSGIVGLLKVGDRVTVVTQDVEGSQVVLASQVRIAALPQPEPSNSVAPQSGALVVLAADASTAAKLAGAGAQSRLGITLG